ncbi:hypothetical protein FI667_g14867, partial [Globisporangium splendens]
MRFTKFVAAALATLVVSSVLVADSTAAKTATLDCTDTSLTAEHDAVQAYIQTCETASGISLVLPMKNAKKLILCEKCPGLLEYKLSKEAPLCNVTISNGQEIRLQTALNRWFNQCSSASSDQGDGSSGSSSAAATTKDHKTKKPKTSAPSPSTSLDSSSEGLSSSSSGFTGSADDGSFENRTTRPSQADEAGLTSGNSSTSITPTPASEGKRANSFEACDGFNRLRIWQS